MTLFLLTASVTTIEAQTEADLLKNQIFGEWIVDPDEFRKELLEAGQVPEAAIDEAVLSVAGAAIAFHEDGSMSTTMPSMNGLSRREGRWSNPRVDVEKKTVTLTIIADDSTREKEIAVQIHEVDNERKLKVKNSSGFSIVFRPANQSADSDKTP